MTVEMMFIWFYYDYVNSHGNNLTSRVLMFVVAIMNAGRAALSFFMLLIVCMGYSIVKYHCPQCVSNVDLLLAQRCGDVRL